MTGSDNVSESITEASSIPPFSAPTTGKMVSMSVSQEPLAGQPAEVDEEEEPATINNNNNVEDKVLDKFDESVSVIITSETGFYLIWPFLDQNMHSRAFFQVLLTLLV